MLIVTFSSLHGANDQATVNPPASFSSPLWKYSGILNGADKQTNPLLWCKVNELRYPIVYIGYHVVHVRKIIKKHYLIFCINYIKIIKIERK